MPNPLVKKLSFNLPEDDIATLRQLAKDRNVSLTFALRQAISDSDFLQRELLDSQKKIELVDGAGNRERLTMRR